MSYVCCVNSKVGRIAITYLPNKEGSHTFRIWKVSKFSSLEILRGNHLVAEWCYDNIENVFDPTWGLEFPFQDKLKTYLY